MKKRVYISLPISGRDVEAQKMRANEVKRLLEQQNYIAVTPFEINPEQKLRYSEYMGKDIATLLECDAVCLVDDWQNSKGCRAEYEVARIYDKEILHIKIECSHSYV